MKTHAVIACLLSLGVLLCPPPPARACLNDRDTLAEEVQGLPDVVQIITGRFERNPPLYYEMRLTRVAGELRANPALLGDYDDAGVACDRLGRDDEALAWMAKKRAQLARPNAATADLHEQQYRYYANIGTFRVHRWLRAGADRKRIGEVEQARDEIAQALQIKPDAHFGREKYQLLVMKWLIQSRTHPAKTDEENTLAWYLGEHTPDTAAAEKGLTGLVVLGNAWESPDVFEALAFLFDSDMKLKLAFLADLRARELRHESLRPLSEGTMTDRDRQAVSYYAALVEGGGAQLERVYPRLRAEAEEWQRQRTAYMIARLQAGRHPDTDTAFWAGYHDAGPPEVTITPPLTRGQRFKQQMEQGAGIVAGGGLCVFTVLLIRRRRQRRRMASSRS